MEITMTRTAHASARARAWFELRQASQRLLADVQTPDQGSTLPTFTGVIDSSGTLLAGANALYRTPVRTGADDAPTTPRMDVERSLPGRPPV